MFLDQASATLGWPEPDEVLTPSGTGARFFASLAQEKLGRAVSRLDDGADVKVGVLVSDPTTTEPPLAIVCEFPRRVSQATLEETHKLAWNFGKAPLLITIEPHIIRKWSCYEPPAVTHEQEDLFHDFSPEIQPSVSLEHGRPVPASEDAAQSLHWVELLSGQFFDRHQERFRHETRADQMLLRNLTSIRRRLMEMGLSDDRSHDLLARIIFVQFLFDRKDPDGRAALDAEELARLHEGGRLSRTYEGLSDILGDYDDTYNLFRYLNERFNGDLFPGKGTPAQQEAAWRSEQEDVRPEHLSLLGRFVGGRENFGNEQPSLWPYYAFDAIPLDLISTIYEQFVKKEGKSGVHYTPGHLVDLVLDSALPWDGDEWQLKVLDPACGSGVFLVKVFQRLVYRWKRANPGRKVTGGFLARMLGNNIVGVDMDAHAVRVASFSLYLAMCDELDPRDYWKEVRFPVLRDKRLITSDFFDEEHPSVRALGLGSFDLVVGNPPWEKGTATAGSPAAVWAKEHGWSVPFTDFGPIFLAKAVSLTKPNGRVALLQPASTLLYNGQKPAARFRHKLFSETSVEEIINFAAFRHILFKDAIVPTCAIILRTALPTDATFWYVCPKPLGVQEDSYRIVVQSQDVHEIEFAEASDYPWMWSALLWGSRRDVELIKRLRRHTTLAELETKKLVKARQGIIRGTVSTEYPELLDRRLLTARDFPGDGDSVFIEAKSLPLNDDPRVNSVNSHDFTVYDLPQLIVKQSFPKDQGRFRAALVSSDADTGGVVCTDSYLSVHAHTAAGERYLAPLCLSLNSRLAVYYLLLTSGRFAMDRNEPQATEFRQVPIPKPSASLMDGVRSTADADERVMQAFRLQDSDRALVEDLLAYTLPDYRVREDAPGSRSTRRGSDTDGERDMINYASLLVRAIRATYGESKPVGAVIFSEPANTERLPVRMLSLFLNVEGEESTRVEPLDSSLLRERLAKIYNGFRSVDGNGGNHHSRSVRAYEAVNRMGNPALRVNLVKPDQLRCWTRSTALRDADEIVADLTLWASGAGAGDRREEAVLA